jgi:hypothetical protein
VAENPRMPLTSRGIAYLFVIVLGALGTAFIVIRGIGILDANLQYNVAISLIVVFIGIFFCQNNLLIGLGRHAVWSFIFALIVFSALYLIDVAI